MLARTCWMLCALLLFLSLASAQEGGAAAAAGAADAPADPLAGIEDPQTLSQLLQWSLANQDLDALHEKAERIRKQGGASVGEEAAQAEAETLDLDGLPVPDGSPVAAAASAASAARVEMMSAERRAELKSLASDLMPDIVQAMRDALAAGTDPSLPLEEREAGLLVLADYAEDIDHAKDLKAIGGFPEVIALLASELPPLQAAAAYILGSSVKNQRELQLHALEERALPSLLRLLRSHADGEVRGKALYAIASLIRNCPEAQQAFGAAGGADALMAVLSAGGGGSAAGGGGGGEGGEGGEGGGEGGGSTGGDLRLVRKALALITDLLREQRDGSAELKVTVVAGADGDTAAATTEATAEGGGGAAAAEGGRGHGVLALWRNASALCESVASCLSQSNDLDAREKAVQALEQLMHVGALRGGGADGGGGCAVVEVRAALRRYREWCEAAVAKAEERGQVEEEDQDGVGLCPELLPTAREIESALNQELA